MKFKNKYRYYRKLFSHCCVASNTDSTGSILLTTLVLDLLHLLVEPLMSCIEEKLVRLSETVAQLLQLSEYDHLVVLVLSGIDATQPQRLIQGSQLRFQFLYGLVAEHFDRFAGIEGGRNGRANRATHT